MDLIRFTQEGTELNRDGLHLPGLTVHDALTLCGAFMPVEPSEAISGDAPTCPNCISAARELLARYSKRQASAWVPNNAVSRAVEK